MIMASALLAYLLEMLRILPSAVRFALKLVASLLQNYSKLLTVTIYLEPSQISPPVLKVSASSITCIPLITDGKLTVVLTLYSLSFKCRSPFL